MYMVFILISIIIGVIGFSDASAEMLNVEQSNVSPLKQITDGILAQDVTCNEGLNLIIRYNDIPACIKSSTVDILIQRGWEIKLVQTSDQEIVQSSDEDLKNKVKKMAIEIWEYGLREPDESDEGYIKGPTENGYEIIFYDVIGDNILHKKSPNIPENLIYLQEDTVKHLRIWNVFTKLIPSSYRDTSLFYLTTDGVGEQGGGVERDPNDTTQWYLLFDILDSYPTENFDYKETIITSIHEFGHILTLGSDQIDVDLELVKLWHQDERDEEKLDRLYEIKIRECPKRALIEDGCANIDSYINLFYQEFWIDILPEWNNLQTITDDEEYFEQFDIFYLKYKDRFVSEYASTHVEEDIAESWTAFVLKDKPSGKTIAEQKILFFYEYSDFIDLRDHIRSQLSEI